MPGTWYELPVDVDAMILPSLETGELEIVLRRGVPELESTFSAFYEIVHFYLRSIGYHPGGGQFLKEEGICNATAKILFEDFAGWNVYELSEKTRASLARVVLPNGRRFWRGEA